MSNHIYISVIISSGDMQLMRQRSCKEILAAHQLGDCPNQKRQGLAHEIEDHEAFCCPRRRVQCPNDCQIFSIEHKKLDAYLEECPWSAVLSALCSFVEVNKNYMSNNIVVKGV